MNRSGWLFFASILFVAAYIGSYVYLVNTHTTQMYFAMDNGPISGGQVQNRFCYAQNPRVDSICNLVFLPVHYTAARIGLQRTVYVSASEQRQEAIFFVRAFR
jgi:hypothetical protein